MRIALAGDVMLGRLVNDSLRTRSAQSIWGDTLPLFKFADLRMCNLECVISDYGTEWRETPKVFHFRSDERNIAVLEAAGIDVVSLANNHALDFGHDAMRAMQRLLTAHGIEQSGAGESLALAAAPAFVSAAGSLVGFLAFTDNQPEWEALPARPGLFYVPLDLGDHRARSLLSLVRDTRSRVDLLVVSAHWGSNWGYEPTRAEREFARALVDAGASIVFGHSCHVVRGIEVYRGAPILYSAGDFIDDYAVDEVERNDHSFLFMVEGTGTFTTLRLFPTVIERLSARRARGRTAREITERMRALCAALGTETRPDGTDGLTVDLRPRREIRAQL